MRIITKHLDHVNIVSDYKSGAAVADLAERHNVGIHIIYKVLEKHGIERVKGRFKKSYAPPNKADIKDEDVVRLHFEKNSFSDIARKLGCSRRVITSRAYKLGLKSAGFSFPIATNIVSQIGQQVYDKLIDRDWLFEQYIGLGKPTRQIADEIGCGKKTVTTFLKRHKIPLKRLHRGFFKSQRCKCCDFWCDSTWEMCIAKHLDEDDAVLKFVKEPFPISYYEDGKQHRYFPDFFVWTIHGEFLLEVKPDKMLPHVEKKVQAAMRSGFKFTVVNKTDRMPWDGGAL